jgi:hypothetical protein
VIASLKPGVLFSLSDELRTVRRGVAYVRRRMA